MNNFQDFDFFVLTGGLFFFSLQNKFAPGLIRLKYANKISQYILNKYSYWKTN